MVQAAGVMRSEGTPRGRHMEAHLRGEMQQDACRCASAHAPCSSLFLSPSSARDTLGADADAKPLASLSDAAALSAHRLSMAARVFIACSWGGGGSQESAQAVVYRTTNASMFTIRKQTDVANAPELDNAKS